MPATIYYVGAKLSLESTFLLWCYTGTLIKNPHTTIIYSRKWFPYKEAEFFPLTIEPPYIGYENFRDQPVLLFHNSRLFERYVELRNLGATLDHETYKMHISIGIAKDKQLPNKLPDFPLTFCAEYYRTWIVGSKS